TPLLITCHCHRPAQPSCPTRRSSDLPSEYIGTNIIITTSGVCSEPTLKAAIGELGPEAVLFSVDYPYESTEIAADFIDSADLSPEVKALVCHKNAERIFKLKYF